VERPGRLQRHSDIADDVGEPGVGERLVLSASHAAADGDIEAFEPARALDGDEAEILGVDVDVVGGRHDEADLELPGQIGGAVDRLLFVARARDLFIAVPDFMIGARPGQEMLADLLRRRRHLRVESRIRRVGGAHDVARDISAGGDGVEKDLVQALDRRPHVLLQNPVELEGLAGGEPQLAAAMGSGELVQLQPLLRSADAAGEPHPDHEAIGRLQFLAPPLVAQVAVVLLIHAVDLHQPCVVGGDGAGDPVEKAGGDGSAKIVAGLLQPLVRAEPVEGLGEVLAPVDEGACVGHQ
jgi:hypothetical protein